MKRPFSSSSSDVTFAIAPSMLHRLSFRCSTRLHWQRCLLLVLGLALALRALAWPLEMSGPQHATATAPAGSAAACHAHERHADPASQQATSPATAVGGGAPASTEEEGVCQILCAIACAPSLLQTAALPARSAAPPRHAVLQPLSLGVVVPPDLPPPIA